MRRALSRPWLVPAAALLAFSPLVAQSASAQQQEEMVFEGYYEGDSLGDDDWFYDSYGRSLEGVDWYQNAFYSGSFDDDTSNDWFFDVYEEAGAGEAGIFDV